MQCIGFICHLVWRAVITLSLQLWQLMFTYHAMGFCVTGRIIITFCWLHICYSVHVLGGTPRLHTLMPQFCNGDVHLIRCVITLLLGTCISCSRFLKLVSVTCYVPSSNKWGYNHKEYIKKSVAKRCRIVEAVSHDDYNEKVNLDLYTCDLKHPFLCLIFTHAFVTLNDKV